MVYVLSTVIDPMIPVFWEIQAPAIRRYRAGPTAATDPLAAAQVSRAALFANRCTTRLETSCAHFDAIGEPGEGTSVSSPTVITRGLTAGPPGGWFIPALASRAARRAATSSMVGVVISIPRRRAGSGRPRCRAACPTRPG